MRRPDQWTKLHIRCNGAASIRDLTSKEILVGGAPHIIHAGEKFRGGCVQFSGSGDDIQLFPSDDWAFGVGDFTIEFFVKFEGTNSQGLVGQRYSETVKWELYIEGGLFHFYARDGNRVIADYEYINALTGWNHLALCRRGKDFSLYINSVKVAWDDVNHKLQNKAMPNVSDKIRFGSRQTPTIVTYLTGCLDEIIVSKGIARYTGTQRPVTRRR